MASSSSFNQLMMISGSSVSRRSKMIDAPTSLPLDVMNSSPENSMEFGCSLNDFKYQKWDAFFSDFDVENGEGELWKERVVERGLIVILSCV